MNRWINRLGGQKNIGKFWGMIAQVAGQVAVFVSIINLFLIAVTAYNTTLSGYFEQHGVHISFWVFALVIVGLLLVAFLLMWKFALPSYYSSFNEQFYRHDNPIRADLEEIKKLLNKDLGNVKKRLDKLEKKEGGK
jgi:hypothetical protein